MQQSPSKIFREAIKNNKPLQILGVINAYCALLAERVGTKALYLSGAGVANASLGLPDLAMATRSEVLSDLRRITNVTSLPILVDIDTGFGHPLNIAQTIKSMNRAGAAAVHIEDQIEAKRCGHRRGKHCVPTQKMVERIQAAVDAKVDPDFIIMARTDAIASEGINAAVDRACAYVEAGADMIFAEAVTELSHYQQFVAATQVPILANCTEFGKTPLFTLKQFSQAGVDMVLYPLTAFRTMSFAAEKTYATILQQGTQQSLLDNMQTREQLYDLLHYAEAEAMLDQYLN